MKAFRYSMESVLHYRRSVEEQEKQKYSQIGRELILRKRILKDYEEKLDAAVSSQCSCTKHKVYEWKSLRQYILFLKKKVDMQRQLVAETEKAAEEKRRQLIHAQRDRKTIEKHKERALEKYDFDLQQAEQKSMDELALYSYIRKDPGKESMKGGE